MELEGDLFIFYINYINNIIKDNQTNNNPISKNQKPRCCLSEANSDFELIIYDNGYKVKTRQESGFQWLWKGIHYTIFS